MEKIAILGTGDAPETDATTPKPIASAAVSFHPELVNVPGAVFPYSPAARDICGEAYLEAGVSAQKSGYSGLYINTVGDYGITKLRQACSIPVTGAGEGAIRTAQLGGRRFAIVSIWPPSMRFIYDAILSTTDASSDCVAIHHLSIDSDLGTMGQASNFVRDMQGCSMTSMAKIREACQRGLEEDQADVIVLGCTCMHPVAALLEADNIPVVEPMVAGYRYLESLLNAKH